MNKKDLKLAEAHPSYLDGCYHTDKNSQHVTQTVLKAGSVWKNSWKTLSLNLWLTFVSNNKRCLEMRRLR